MLISNRQWWWRTWNACYWSGWRRFRLEDTHFGIITEVEDFATVRDALAEVGHEFLITELCYLPQTMTELTTAGNLKSMNKLIDL